MHLWSFCNVGTVNFTYRMSMYGEFNKLTAPLYSMQKNKWITLGETRFVLKLSQTTMPQSMPTHKFNLFAGVFQCLNSVLQR